MQRSTAVSLALAVALCFAARAASAAEPAPSAPTPRLDESAAAASDSAGWIDASARTALGQITLRAPWLLGANVSVTGGVMQDFALPSATGVWARASASRDIGALRVVTSLQAEHGVLAGRDAVDLMLAARATYALAAPLRVGVQYIAQDIEAGLDGDEADGARQYVGPVVELDWLRKLSIVAGPTAGISPGTTPIGARLGLFGTF